LSCFEDGQAKVAAVAHSSSFTSWLKSLSSGFGASEGGEVDSAISAFSPKIRVVNCLASLSKSTHSGTILLAP
jgi:cephalosporin-C deacetylase-like acetyl esterase